MGRWFKMIDAGWCQCLGAAAVLAGLATPVQGQSCAVAYHGALAGIGAGEGRQLKSLGALVRGPAPDFTGRWLFAPPSRNNRDAARNRVARVCAETVVRYGRSRCVRWEATAPAAAPLLAAAPPSREETALQKFVEDTVTQRGAIPEFGNNGRFYFVFNRVIAEFDSYLTQPANPALCAGVPHYLDFLLEQMQPVRRRMDDVAGADARAREVADARVATLVRLAKAGADQATAGDATSDAAAKPAAPPPEASPPRPRPVGYGALIDETLRLALIGPESTGDTATAIVRLQRARKQLAASPAEPARAGLREAALAALRVIEAGIYAEHIKQRFDTVERVVFATATDVRAAHTRTCTCAE